MPRMCECLVHSGLELTGNKVRTQDLVCHTNPVVKLDFLIADALEKNADCVITGGGIHDSACCYGMQTLFSPSVSELTLEESNHARATAAAWIMEGWE